MSPLKLLPPLSLSPPPPPSHPQVAVEDQMRQVKAGCDLSSMERIPSPVVHIPPQLGMMMMRPGFFPMMPMPRAPFGLGGMVRPQQMGGIPPMVSASVVE